MVDGEPRKCRYWTDCYACRYAIRIVCPYQYEIESIDGCPLDDTEKNEMEVRA